MADNINDINKEIQELRAQLSKLPDSPFPASELQKAKEALKGLRSELREMSGDLNYIAKSFQDSVDELSRQNTYLNSARSSLRGISDISRQLVDFRRGENSLSDKQLTNLKNQARVKFEQLDLSIKSGRLGVAEAQEAGDALARQRVFTDALDRTLDLQNQVNREVGLLGQGLEGAGKFLEKMGFAGIAKPISDAIKKTKEARLQYKLNQDAIADIRKELELLGAADPQKTQELEDQLELYQQQNKELSTQTSKYKNIVSSIKDQLTQVNLVDYAIDRIITGYFEVNKAAVEYQRLTGKNAVAIAGMNSSLATSVDVLTLMAEITKQTGVSASSIFSEEDLGRLAAAKNLLGLSGEQATNLGRRSKLTGQSIDGYQKSIVAATNKYNGLNGTAVAHGVVMQDVLNTSDEISLSLGGDAAKISAAATAARGLGLELSKVDQIAGSILQFEDSIGKELEAELLTGKNLNLEKAREFALTGNLAGLSDELKKNGATAAEFAGMNRIEQEALAAALGMSRQELAKTVMAQENSKNLTIEQRAAAVGVTVEQMRSMDIQTQMTKTLDKLAQSFAPILEALVPIAETLLTAIQPIAMVIGYLASGLGSVLSFLSPLITGFIIIYGLVKAIQLRTMLAAGYESFKTGQLIAQRGAALGYNGILLARQAILKGELAKAIGIAAAYAIANPFAALAGLAIAATVGYVVNSQMQDGIIDPKKGPVISGDFGSVQLDPNDKAMYGADGKIKVGTDLIGNKTGGKASTTISGAVAKQQDNRFEMVGALQEQISVLKQILNKDTNINFDSNKANRFSTLQSYKLS